MWRRVPQVMQKAIKAARERENIKEVDGKFVQVITKPDGTVQTETRSEKFENSGY